MDLPRPTVRASMPAGLAPHSGAEAVQVTSTAAGVALNYDWHGIEQLAVTARSALHAEPVSFAGKVGDQLEARASHASAMLGGRSVGNGMLEQSVNRSVDRGEYQQTTFRPPWTRTCLR